MKETLEFYKKLHKYSPPRPQTWRGRDYYLQGKLAMLSYSTYIMDDLALAEVAAGSLTGENFADLSGSSFDPELVANTRMVSFIKNRQKSSYGVVVTMGLVKTSSAEKSNAAKQLLKYMFEEDAYVTFLHMAPGGMNPVIRSISKSKAYMNDSKGILRKYGEEKVFEIASGLDHLQKFEIVNGRLFPASGEIFSKKIIPQMIFKTLFENIPSQKALDWAENEMQKIIHNRN